MRNEDESHVNVNVNAGVVSKDSPEWLKADGEFSFYHHHNFDSGEPVDRLYYYHHQYYHDGDLNMRHSSSQHLSWTEPVNEPDDIDRIYENMRGLSSTLGSQQRQHQNNSRTGTTNTVSGGGENVSNNRKLTKDSGYESASASISWRAMNANTNTLSNNYFHSRSDSNASSVSTGGSLSPRTAGNSNKKYMQNDINF